MSDVCSSNIDLSCYWRGNYHSIYNEEWVHKVCFKIPGAENHTISSKPYLDKTASDQIPFLYSDKKLKTKIQVGILGLTLKQLQKLTVSIVIAKLEEDECYTKIIGPRIATSVTLTKRTVPVEILNLSEAKAGAAYKLYISYRHDKTFRLELVERRAAK